jgi:hypothetical protein
MGRLVSLIGVPLGLPLTLALSPQAGRGDRTVLVARARRISAGARHRLA